MRENPVISDWVPISGGSTEGLLGGWLAQRQAALRGMVAAGALSTFTLGRPCVPTFSRAPRVPQRNIFWKGEGISLRKTRPGPELHRSAFESFANIDQQQMSFNSNHSDTGLDARRENHYEIVHATVRHAPVRCPPGIRSEVTCPNLAEQCAAYGGSFLMTIESDNDGQTQSGNKGEDADQNKKLHWPEIN